METIQVSFSLAFHVKFLPYILGFLNSCPHIPKLARNQPLIPTETGPLKLLQHKKCWKHCNFQFFSLFFFLSIYKKNIITARNSKLPVFLTPAPVSLSVFNFHFPLCKEYNQQKCSGKELNLFILNKHNISDTTYFVLLVQQPESRTWSL